MILHFQATTKMPKRILSRRPEFNRFLQSYLLTTSNVAHFATKKESMIIPILYEPGNCRYRVGDIQVFFIT